MTKFTKWANRALNWQCRPCALGYVITCSARHGDTVTSIPVTVTHTHILTEDLPGLATATAILALRAAMVKILANMEFRAA